MEQFHYYANDYLDDVYIPEIEDNLSVLSNSSSDNDAFPDTAAGRRDTDNLVTPDNSDGLANVRNYGLSRDSRSWQDCNQNSSYHILWDELQQGKSKERPCQSKYNQSSLTWSHTSYSEHGVEGITSEPDPKQQNFGNDYWGMCEDMGQNILKGSFGSAQAADSMDAAWSPSVLDQGENRVEPGQDVPVEPPDCASKAYRGEAATWNAGVLHSKGLNQMPWSSKGKEFSFLECSQDAVSSLHRKDQPCRLQVPSNGALFQSRSVQNFVVGQSEIAAESASASLFPQKYVTQAKSTSLPYSTDCQKLGTCGRSYLCNTAEKNTLNSGASFSSTNLPETTAAGLQPAGQSIGASDLHDVQSEPERRHPEEGHSSPDNLDSDHSSAPNSGQFWRMVQEACEAGNASGCKRQEPDAEPLGDPLPTNRPEINSPDLTSMTHVDLLSGLSLNPGKEEYGLNVKSSQDQPKSGAINSSNADGRRKAASVSLLQQKSQPSSVSSMQLLTSQSSSLPVQRSEEKSDISDLVPGQIEKSGAKASTGRREQEDEVRHFGMISQLSCQKGIKAVEDKEAQAAHLWTVQPGKGGHVRSQGSGRVDTNEPISQDIKTNSSQPRSEPGVVGLQNPVPSYRKGPHESQNLGTSGKGQLGSAVPKEAPQDTVMGANNQCVVRATNEVKQNAGATSKDSDPSACDSVAVEKGSPSCSLSIPDMSGSISSLSPYSVFTSMAMSCSQAQVALKDQAWTEANLEVGTVQGTWALREAEEVLSSPEYYRVILNGLPGSGKKTLAHSLLRRCKGLENMPLLVIKSFSEWREHVFGQDQESGKSQVLLLHHIFGQGMLKNLTEWRQVFDVMTQFCEQGKTRLIFTFYPHVLQALREFEPLCKLFSKDCEVKIEDRRLSENEKREILKAHLKSNQNAMHYLNSLLQFIEKEDKSGEMFPGCCYRLADFVSHYDPPSESESDEEEDMHFRQYLYAGVKLFSRPSPVYKDFFLRLLDEDRSQKELLLAAFSFLLNEMDLTDIHSGTNSVAVCCQKYGFSSACSQVSLCEVLMAFHPTLVAKDCRTFVNRMAYEGVALAIAQHHASLVIHLADWPFLVKRCYVPLSKTVVDDTIKPFVVTVKRLDDAKTKQTSEYQALVERLAQGLIKPDDMMLAVQHKALQSRAFTKDMMMVWMSGKIEAAGKDEAAVLKTLSETFDSMHKLPLLYWSLFNDSSFFFEWIIKQVPQQKEGLVLAAYACCVLKGKSKFLRLLLKYWKKLTSEEVDHLLAGKHTETHSVFVPLPTRRMCLASAWSDQIRSMQKRSPENSYTLTYETDNYVAPESSHSLLKVGAGREKTQKKKGKEGLQLYQPPLHLAVLYDNTEIVDLFAEFSGNFKAKDHLGQTALHVATFLGQMDMMQTLLRHCPGLASIPDKMDNYPLHVACQQDQAEVVQLLMKADPRVAKFKNRLNSSPFDLAPDLCQAASVT